jgi:hypothetical protein
MFLPFLLMKNVLRHGRAKKTCCHGVANAELEGSTVFATPKVNDEEAISGCRNATRIKQPTTSKHAQRWRRILEPGELTQYRSCGKEVGYCPVAPLKEANNERGGFAKKA